MRASQQSSPTTTAVVITSVPNSGGLRELISVIQVVINFLEVYPILLAHCSK